MKIRKVGVTFLKYCCRFYDVDDATGPGNGRNDIFTDVGDSWQLPDTTIDELHGMDFGNRIIFALSGGNSVDYDSRLNIRIQLTKTLEQYVNVL